MPDKTTIQAQHGSPSEPRPHFDDPDLVEEWNALEDPEDRADYLEAVQALAALDEEELAPWDDVKAELGY